jgi:N-methylhydantoinase A
VSSAATTRNDRGGWRIGVDTGGTFTDLVAVSPDGEVRLRKVSSTPSEPSLACFEALRRTDLDLSRDIGSFVLGTTIATNALLQRSGTPTMFLTTAGFEDILYIQRIDRRGLYNLQWIKPTPYVARRHCFGVRERVLADGQVRLALSGEEIDRVTRAVGAFLTENPNGAVAVSLLFSYVSNAHERRLAERLRETFPGLALSVSSEVAPIWREYERGNTTVMDAYVKPIVREFADSLEAGLDERTMSGWRALMKSNGGQVALDHTAERPVEIVLSGLAAGMIAGNFFARAVKSTKAVTLDMGGTSADVGVVVEGQLKFSGLFEVEWGLPIALPIIDVSTIGAGGSSIASIDYGGLLKVGPESAGADPGPACYGRGGLRPTITDANLYLGRLNPQFFLGGEILLDAEKAKAALQTLTGPLRLPLDAVADAIISVSVENMAGAVRIVTADRGLDYREFDLVAFGGAGPLHAVEIARRLGMKRVVVPPSPGLVSAFGAVIADERIDRRTTLVRRLDRPEANDLPKELSRLAASAASDLTGQLRTGSENVIVSTYVACRYIGQNHEQEIRMEHGHVDKSFELAVHISPTAGDFMTQLIDRFHAAHKKAYGYDMLDQPIQSVYLGATALVTSEPAPARPYHPTAKTPPSSKRSILVGAGEWAQAHVFKRDDLPSGYECEGPAIIEEQDSTTYVPPGFNARVDDSQCLLITKAT